MKEKVDQITNRLMFLTSLLDSTDSGFFTNTHAVNRYSIIGIAVTTVPHQWWIR